MRIFDYENYKDFVREWITALPNRGHGFYTRIADQLSVTTVLVSQIFRGDQRDLTLEQALTLGQFLGLNDSELEYFILLVELNRAGSSVLKKYFERKLAKVKANADEVSEVLNAKNMKLTEEACAEFYSHWYYMAVWMATSMPGFNTPNDFCHRLGLDLVTVNRTLYFLQRVGIIIKTETGYTNGPAHIHIEASSIHAGRHHANWRILNLAQLDQVPEDELCFSMPCTLSEKDFRLIKSELLQVIKRVTQRVTESPSDTMAVMTLDWRRFKQKVSR
jgi:uncharacterized protein (TIGR02147 family)